MLEGGIKKLESAHSLKRRELENQRSLGRSIKLEAAGIVAVIAEQPDGLGRARRSE
jgi:hypothetical protein